MGLGDYKERYLGYKMDAYLYQKPAVNTDTFDTLTQPEAKSSLRDFLDGNHNEKVKIDVKLEVPGSSQTHDNEEQVIQISYLCPIRGCGMRMSMTGLKDGSAANHMNLSHQLRPYKMNKLKLKWQKVEECRTLIEVKHE